MISKLKFSGKGIDSSGMGKKILTVWSILILWDGSLLMISSISKLLLSINFFILLLVNDRWYLFSSCFAVVLTLRASVTQTSILLRGILKSLTRNKIFIGFFMSNISNPNETAKPKILANIRFVKIIAIILGILIILGLFFLFIGLAKSYKNLNDIQKIESSINGKDQGINVFNFYQPLDAQLISSSLGDNNKVLLRYLYDGDNVLIVIDSRNNKMETIIKIKKDEITW